MGSIVEESPVILPSAELKELAQGISLLPPLTRRGYGPGLIIILPQGTPDFLQGGTVCSNGIPPPILKWSEEGFAVVQILECAFERVSGAIEVLDLAVSELRQCNQCHEKDGIGLIVYSAALWNKILSEVNLPPELLAASFYGQVDEPLTSLPIIPCLQHVAGSKDTLTTTNKNLKCYHYPAVKTSRFAIPGDTEFEETIEAIAHSRNLTFLKRHIRGADFDLEAIWEEHCYFEFDDRSVPKTMGTMVQEPYVNHIPTLTGGIGRKLLTSFYRDHFIFSNPRDTHTELISRTVGIDRICDEFVYKCTHDCEIDWLIPGIPPTGRKLQIAFTAVVNIRGDRLYHEHIAWDQASVLMQLGLMPTYLPYPYTLPGGREPGPGMLFEYRIPATGVDTVLKMLDKNGVASNQMLEYKIREVAE